MQQRFKDKVVIVTGGGKGIGRACAIAFAQEGGKIVIADVDVDAGQESLHLIKKTGSEAIFTKCNVAKSNNYLSGWTCKYNILLW